MCLEEYHFVSDVYYNSCNTRVTVEAESHMVVKHRLKLWRNTLSLHALPSTAIRNWAAQNVIQVGAGIVR